MSRPQLRSGDRLPRVVRRPPGPRSRLLAESLERFEAPGVNTLFGGRPGIVWQEAVGANVLDVDGNLYIDLTAGFGVAAVGHRRPEVVAAVSKQSGLLLHGLADVAAHPARIALAERLAGIVPVADAQIYFAVSGSDAVEIALATAWLSTGRRGTVAFEPAYHGTTLGALAATSRPAFREPFLEQLNPHIDRLPHGCDPADLESLLDGRDDVAALLVEPVPGREGAPLPPAGWLSAIADCCRRHEVLLIADEIFSGLGRTGAWFACQEEDVVPDLLCCGKALGGGLPIAVVAGRTDLLACWQRGGEALHTATFIAHPLACAAALATLDVLSEEDLPARARRLGDMLAARASTWQRQGSVSEVRGRGLFWVVEIESAARAAELAERALGRGLILLASGSRLQMAPPLTITERQWNHCLATLEELIAAPGELRLPPADGPSAGRG